MKKRKRNVEIGIELRKEAEESLTIRRESGCRKCVKKVRVRKICRTSEIVAAEQSVLTREKSDQKTYKGIINRPKIVIDTSKNKRVI